MTKTAERRLRSLEAGMTRHRSSCAACPEWGCHIVFGDEPDPPMSCPRCGRLRPDDAFVVRFISREDGPQ